MFVFATVGRTTFFRAIPLRNVEGKGKSTIRVERSQKSKKRVGI